MVRGRKASTGISLVVAAWRCRRLGRERRDFRNERVRAGELAFKVLIFKESKRVEGEGVAVDGGETEGGRRWLVLAVWWVRAEEGE